METKHLLVIGLILLLSSMVFSANIIQIRRDIAANWTSADPTLAQGEMGLETDTLRIKFGDGSTAWTSLAYYSTNGGGDGGTTYTSGTPATLQVNNDANTISMDFDGNFNSRTQGSADFNAIYLNSGVGDVLWSELAPLFPIPDVNVLNFVRYKQDASCDSNSFCTLLASTLDTSFVTSAVFNASWPVADVNVLPAGSDTEIQFNDGGALGTDSNFTYNKTIDAVSVGGIQFDADVEAFAYSEGFLFYDNEENTLSLFVNESEVKGQILKELWIDVTNETGVSIENGTVVYISGVNSSKFLLERADANVFETTDRLIGVATHTIENDTNGLVTVFGVVNDVNTSGFVAGDILYLDANVSIGRNYTNARPIYPNFDIRIGIAKVIDDVNGSIEVNPKGTIEEIIENTVNGSFLESFDFGVVSNGTTITGNLQSKSGGNLTMLFSDGFSRLDCTPSCDINLTAGTSSNPQTNFVYILQSGKVLVVSTSDWPDSVEHIKVAQVSVLDANITQLKGALRNQNWNDHIADVSKQGHDNDQSERLRVLNALWWAGVEGTVSIDSVPDPDDVFVSTTSGQIYQLHRQTQGAMDMNTGNDMYVVNDSVSAYDLIDNLNTQIVDATGATLSNRNFSFVVWGIINSGDQNNHYMLNLPNCSYTSSAGAIADTAGCSVFDIPSDFRGVGFLIARFTFNLSSASGGTWTLNDTQDLRGFVPNNTAGSGAGGTGVTTFLGLTDTPSAYTSQGLKLAQVNSGETALEFTDAPTILGTNFSVIPVGAIPDFNTVFGFGSLTNTFFPFWNVNQLADSPLSTDGTNVTFSSSNGLFNLSQNGDANGDVATFNSFTDGTGIMTGGALTVISQIGTSGDDDLLALASNLLTINGNVDLTGQAFTTLEVSGSTAGQIFIIDSGAGINDKTIMLRNDGGNFIFNALNDAEAVVLANIINLDLNTGATGFGQAPDTGLGLGGVDIAGDTFIDGNATIGGGTPTLNALAVVVNGSSMEMALTISNTANRFLKIGVEGNDVTKIAFDQLDSLEIGTILTVDSSFSSFTPLFGFSSSGDLDVKLGDFNVGSYEIIETDGNFTITIDGTVVETIG